MKEFNLSGVVTVSVYTTIKAKSLEEAIEIAEGRSIEKYNWGSKSQSKEVWVNDEYDGEVLDIKESD
jgi:hypothetical protein